VTGRVRALWNRLGSTLWFVPGAIALAMGGLAIGMIQLSAHVDDEALRRFPRVFGASAESSRAILTAVAGATITVAGLTFSLTMVAVTQASSQYTPRILGNFMRDRASQAFLGLYVGIFTYCLLVARTIRSGEEGRFLPSLAVVLGIALAIVGVGTLIFFIHHLASALQASSVVARVARDTIAAVERLYPEEVGDEAPDEAAAPAGARWHDVRADATGYLQSVDGEALLRLADERDVVVRLLPAVGDFVVQGEPVLATSPGAPDAAFERRIRGALVVARERTVEQDAAYGVRQLVDVALRALSPGVNDTTTATTCVDYLGAVLVRVARAAGGSA
jgi:uncharacterized membrane protein